MSQAIESPRLAWTRTVASAPSTRRLLLGKTEAQFVDLEVVEPARRALTSTAPFALRHMRPTIPVPHACFQTPIAATSGALRRFARAYARSRWRRQLVISDRSPRDRSGRDLLRGQGRNRRLGGVVVVVGAAVAGDVILGADFDWACAAPLRTATTQHPASDKEQAREILDTGTRPVRSLCLLLHQG